MFWKPHEYPHEAWAYLYSSRLYFAVSRVREVKIGCCPPLFDDFSFERHSEGYNIKFGLFVQAKVRNFLCVHRIEAFDDPHACKRRRIDAFASGSFL